MHILVTRPQGQEASIVSALEEQGYQVSHQPALTITPLPIEGPERQKLRALDNYDVVFVVSANAARVGLVALSGFWPQWPVGVQWVAVGDATAEVLRQQGIDPEVPAEGFNTEAVLQLPALQNLEGKKVLVLSGEGGRELFEQTLQEQGAQVDTLALYYRSPNEDFQWPEKHIEGVLVTSVESWQSLYATQQEKLKDVLVIAGGERIADAVRDSGHESLIIADTPRDVDMLAAVKNALPVKQAISPKTTHTEKMPSDTAEKNTPLPSPPSTTATSSSRGGGFSLLLLVLLIVFGLTAWFARDWLDDAEQERQQLQQQLQEMNANLGDLARQQRSLQQQHRDNISRLESQLDSQRREFQQLAEAGQDIWLMREAEALASLAQQRLFLTADVSAAARLLRASDQLLARLDTPRAMPARQAVAADLNRLHQAADIDTTTLLLQLMALEDQLQTLSQLPAPATFDLDVEALQDETQQSLWWRLLEALPLDVKRHDEPLTTPLPIQQRQLLVQSLQVSMQQASLALMQGRSDAYHQSLRHVRQQLEHHWPREPAVRGIIGQLADFIEQPLAEALPDISASVSAIRALRAGEAD